MTEFWPGTWHRLVPALPAIALLAACAGAPIPTGSAPPGDRLQQLTDDWRARADVEAVAVTVDPAGPASWTATSGVADADGSTRLRRSHQFRIASITKTYVATVVLQLVEESRLRLDGRLTAYLPDAPVPPTVTLRHLLAHTSGIPDYERLDGFVSGLLADRQRRWTADELVDLVADYDRDFAPGTAYSYSNTGYVLLGQVIEAVTGTSWADQVRQRIIDPLRLDDTYVDSGEPVAERLVAAYADADNDGEREEIEEDSPWPALATAEGPAGAIISTAPDVARFADALFRGRLVADASLRAMVEEQPFHPRNSDYGLGVEITRPDYETTIWGHGGSLPGWRSVMWFVPSRDLVVVVLTNDSLANPPDLAELAMRTLAGATDARREQ